MPDFDFAAWVRRATGFVEARRDRPGFVVEEEPAAGPLSAREIDALARRLERTLPSSLRGFLEHGAAALASHYRFEYDPDIESETELFLAVFPDQTSLYGGPSFGPAWELPDYARSCREWAQQFDEVGDPASAKVWGGALPIIAVANGDYLALDYPSDDLGASSDPPVVYLSHDDESVQLTTSFTSFLTVWEQLCYVGPEIWMLDSFRGPDGLLRADTSAAAQLRRLLE
ncbi:MAG TPA: SMI1/KNR4 family protein [Gemmatimonadaceae bacterium]|nr:SMI1/KNR4 family protein [Gemmatimonadaceae bacterium]